jgi:hypothetical protein
VGARRRRPYQSRPAARTPENVQQFISLQNPVATGNARQPRSATNHPFVNSRACEHLPVMKGILLVDHGSRLEEANAMLISMAQLVQQMAGSHVVVRPAHMELAEPSIRSGFDSCVEAGATEVIVFPYMLSPGKHSTMDIPRMVREVAAAHPDIAWSVTPAFGIHEKLGEVILDRAGLTTP